MLSHPEACHFNTVLSCINNILFCDIWQPFFEKNHEIDAFFSKCSQFYSPRLGFGLERRAVRLAESRSSDCRWIFKFQKRFQSGERMQICKPKSLPASQKPRGYLVFHTADGNLNRSGSCKIRLAPLLSRRAPQRRLYNSLARISSRRSIRSPCRSASTAASSPMRSIIAAKRSPFRPRSRNSSIAFSIRSSASSSV